VDLRLAPGRHVLRYDLSLSRLQSDVVVNGPRVRSLRAGAFLQRYRRSRHWWAYRSSPISAGRNPRQASHVTRGAWQLNCPDRRRWRSATPTTIARSGQPNRLVS
jgi:hypothetical protein